MIAKGSFSVDMKQDGQNKEGNISFGKYSLEKIFHGDLEATSKVDMLSAGSDNGSGVYVAIERVNGTLNGKSGTFLLAHTGTRTKTSSLLTVTVVPGCGTGDLAGLQGKFGINIVGKDHYYEFEYTL